MDFEKLVSGHKSRTCVISVQKYEDGSYGDIRIVTSNKIHQDDAEKVFHRPFVPNSPYYYYLPKNKNFEDYMYRCACNGQPLHTYVHVEEMGLWVNMFLLPLESDKENVGYCFYSCDISPYADPEQQASLAADTATRALEISIKLGRANKENTQQVFDELIEDIRQMCGAEYCGIILSDFEGCKYSRFCDALSDESTIEPSEIYNDSHFYDIADTFPSTLNGSSCVIINDENDMKWLETINPHWHSALKKHKAKSVILFPLKHNEHTLGYLAALNYKTEDTVRIKETLELSTYFIASEIANFRLIRQLEFLGSIDILTGCRNRNALNDRVDKLASGESKLFDSIGIVFFDLNGLKAVNDEKGHNAGDRLLSRAAGLLKIVFGDYEIYRAGGDEFVVFISDTDENVIKQQIAQLRALAENTEDVSFAIGSYFCDGDYDICNAMQLADERMYKDKEEYYSQHPDKERRKSNK